MLVRFADSAAHVPCSILFQGNCRNAIFVFIFPFLGPLEPAACTRLGATSCLRASAASTMRTAVQVVLAAALVALVWQQWVHPQLSDQSVATTAASTGDNQASPPARMGALATFASETSKPLLRGYEALLRATGSLPSVVPLVVGADAILAEVPELAFVLDNSAVIQREVAALWAVPEGRAAFLAYSSVLQFNQDDVPDDLAAAWRVASVGGLGTVSPIIAQRCPVLANAIASLHAQLPAFAGLNVLMGGGHDLPRHSDVTSLVRRFHLPVLVSDPATHGTCDGASSASHQW